MERRGEERRGEEKMKKTFACFTVECELFKVG
jgi:hypothetical protein